MFDISEIEELQGWIRIVEENSDDYRVCWEQQQLIKHIKACFERQAIHIDMEQLSGYMRILNTYVPYQVFPWEKFIITLHLCTYWDDTNDPRWPDLLTMLGRGNGKDGLIAMEAFCLTSPFNPVPDYDVDICANNEEQAMRPVEDLIGFLEEPKHTKKLAKYWKWLKESVKGLRNKGKVRGRTNSPKGKDGLRSGMVALNEIHQYENYANINVFTTGLGKKAHPRRGYYTTNGEVREGPLDDYIADSMDILENPEVLEDNGWLPFLCRLKDKSQIDDELNWPMANPSLPYLRHLKTEMKKEYKEWKQNPGRLRSFVEKRMNLIEHTREAQVVEWKYIEQTNKELPDLKGWQCTVGIDLSKTTDWAAVNYHFKDGDDRYDINFAWICGQSKDLTRIKAPWKDWVKKGDVYFVDDVEINPRTIAEHIKNFGKQFSIQCVCMDGYRYSLMADALRDIGFCRENKNIHLVAQRDIIQIVPIIERCFINGYFHWGNVPHLRWATNNTKLIPYGRKEGADKGSFVYAKIEAKSRKTDPFMALVASMIKEEAIKPKPKVRRLSVITM